MVDTSKLITDTKLAGVYYGVFYSPTTNAVYGAERIQRLTAVFESQPIDGSDQWMAWKTLSWTSVVPESARLYVYVRSSSDQETLSTEAWQGPYLNGSADLAGFTGRWIQINMVLYADAVSNLINPPLVNSMTVSSHVSSGAKLFFTKKFNLGFRPKNILLTYNGSVPEGAMVQFAVTGDDSSDQVDYQVITPNKVVIIDNLPFLSDGLKVMMRATGSTEIPFTIDEFSLAVSGDGQKVIS
jgi:hypothetical protein